MTPIFSFTVDGRKYSFVDTYSNNDYPLPGDYITYPIFSGMRSCCAYNECSDCYLHNASYHKHGACHLPLIHSPHIANIIPDHIKQSFPEYFI